MIDDLWYKNSIFYSLQVETFMDSNGDGVEADEPHVIRLDPYGYRWFRVGTVNYALQRERI